MHTFQQKVTMLGSLSCALRAQVNISLKSFTFYAICPRCRLSLTKSSMELEFGSIFIALSDALKTIYNNIQ
jgi:hypothetical protein